MIRYYKTPLITRWIYPSLIWNKKSKKTIYLTFDDGPDEKVTPWVLDELGKWDAKATFFVLGRNLSTNVELIGRMKSKGHLIGNHTMHHLNGWKMASEAYLKDVNECDATLEQIGIKNPYFRPPYGKIKRGQIDALKNKKIIMWSHLAWDFDQHSNLRKSLSTLKKAKPGSIICFHDSKKAFQKLKQILPALLDHFNERGYSFNTLRYD